MDLSSSYSEFRNELLRCPASWPTIPQASYSIAVAAQTSRAGQTVSPKPPSTSFPPLEIALKPAFHALPYALDASGNSFLGSRLLRMLMTEEEQTDAGGKNRIVHDLR